MYTVTKHLKFCAAHRLWGYSGPCQNIHGHNYRVDVTLGSSELDSLGFVVDFGEVKSKLQNWLDAAWDHALIVHGEKDPIQFAVKDLGIKIYILPCNPTAENMARIIYGKVQESFPALIIVSVRVWETDTSFAEYTE